MDTDSPDGAEPHARRAIQITVRNMRDNGHEDPNLEALLMNYGQLLLIRGAPQDEALRTINKIVEEA